VKFLVKEILSVRKDSIPTNLMMAMLFHWCDNFVCRPVKLMWFRNNFQIKPHKRMLWQRNTWSCSVENLLTEILIVYAEMWASPTAGSSSAGSSTQEYCRHLENLPRSLFSNLV